MTTENGVIAADRIAALEHQVRVLAWLHQELVHQIQTFINQTTGTPTTIANTPQAQAIRARAIRIAQIRAAQAAAQGSVSYSQ